MNALATLNDQFRKSWREVVFTSGIINGVSDHFGLAQAVELPLEQRLILGELRFGARFLRRRVSRRADESEHAEDGQPCEPHVTSPSRAAACAR